MMSSGNCEDLEQSEDQEEGEMDPAMRNALNRCRTKIIKDLDIKFIIDALIENNIVDSNFYALIKNLQPNDQARELLDILPRKGSKAFMSFVETLKDDYDWLADELQEALDLGPVSGILENSTDEPDDAIEEASPEERLKDLLNRGGVPSRPSHNVIRQEELDNMRSELTHLAPGNFLVIHGMSGSGKTVLAAEAIRDPDLALKHFPDGIFWFRVGLLEPDKLLNRIKILLEKLNAPNVNSVATVEMATEMLRKSFLNQFKRSLLILDDVWSSQIVKHFEVCARVLVTTQDVSVLDVIPKDMVKVIQVYNGLTLEESLKLFSSYVDIPVEYLPEEAKDIHHECNGSPMVISMIGGLISESGRHSQRQRQSGRWGYYLNSLKTKHYSILRKKLPYEHSSVFEAVGMSIENLSDYQKKRYKQLAVFLDDVGIPPKVLMTYWEMDEYQVEDIMTEFLKKSLSQSEFDSNLDCYVFTIHDMQLNYLKSQIRADGSEDAEAKLHKDFMSQYFKQVDNKYGDIKDDSYIFYNFGYHLFKSGQYDLFPKVYLDLEFIEAMLRATSLVDLLNDFKRYGDQIIGQDEEFLQDLEDYEAFARTVGALVYNTTHVDIIQLALSEPEESAVFKAAKCITLQRPQRLYLEWRNRERAKSPHTATILHHGSVKAAAFLPDITNILTTNDDGQVKVWDVRSGEVLHRFTGHKSSVLSLVVSPGGDMFASGSEDGAVKIWDLGGFQVDGVADTENQHRILRRGSVRGRSFHMKPHTRQSVNSLLTKEHEIRDLSNQSFVFNELHHESVLTVEFDPEGEEVVAGGQSGLVKVFNLKSRDQRLVIDFHKEPVNTATFSPSGQIICSGSDDGQILLWSAKDGTMIDHIGSLHGDERILKTAFLPHSFRKPKIISMSPNRLVMWDSPASKRPNRSLHIMEFRRTKQSYFICMKLSPTGDYLAAGTADNIITIWKLSSAEVVFSFPGHNDSIHALDFTSDNTFLLSGSIDETIMIWSLEGMANEAFDENEPEEKQSFMPCLGPTFDGYFDSMNSSLVAAPNDSNSICILKDGELIHQSPTDPSLITCVAMAENGQVAAYGCTNGFVRLYFPRSHAVKALGNHDHKVSSLAISIEALADTEVAVVASGCKHGSFRIWWEGGRALKCEDKLSSQVVQICILPGQKVLTRTRSKGYVLALWSLVNGRFVSGFKFPHDDNDSATCMEVSRSNLAALGSASGSVYIFDLASGSLEAPLKVIIAKPVLGPVRILRFTPDGKLLCSGHDTGALEIETRFQSSKKMRKKSEDHVVLQVWDVNTSSKVYSPLRLHQSWVTDIQFSKDNVRMVTVGDKIAWWSLDHMPRQKTSSAAVNPKSRKNSVNIDTNNIFKRRRRTGSESQGVSPIKMDLEESKIGRPHAEELLQVFDIRGTAMTRIQASDDFKKFVTIDDAGIVYILEEIQNSISS